MKHQLIQLNLFHVSEGSLSVVVYVQADDLPRVYFQWEHKYDHARLMEELSGLERCLRRRVTKSHEAAALEGHARLLFDLFLPLGLKRILRNGVGTLAIHSTATRLPWSILHDGSDFLGLRWSIGSLERSAASLTDTKAVRTRLLVIADPAEDLPAARYEGEALARTNAALGSDSGCDVRLGRLRKNDFMRMLSRYDLIHFAGHADEKTEASDGGWRFSDGHLSPQDIATIRGGAAPRMVFANACKSDISDVRLEFLQAGVHHYIGTRIDLPDLGGAEFAAKFYAALNEGETVGNALLEARQNAASRGDWSWLAYTLSGDPCVQYFRPRVLDSLPLGVRRGGLLVVSPPVLPDDVEAFSKAYDNWRTRIRQHASELGGRLLPGRGRYLRVIFGVPISYENDAVRATQAALKMLGEFPQCTIIVGQGDVITSGVDVQGPVFHRAQGLVESTRSGVFLMASMVKTLGARCLTGELAEDGLTELLQLVPLEAQAITPLIGRQTELDWLSERAETTVTEGQGTVVSVVASAGMGKSHLARVFSRSIQPNLHFYFGQAPAYNRAAPYAAFCQIVRHIVDLDENESSDNARQKLRMHLSKLAQRPRDADNDLEVVSIDWLLDERIEGPELVDHLEPLMAILGYPVTKPLERVEQIPSAFAALVDAESGNGPVGVIIEDIHWLPDAGLKVVEELVNVAADSNLFIILTSRPGVVHAMEQWRKLPYFERRDLGPLDRRSAETVIRQSVPTLNGDDLETLVSRAEGNPLFLRELALVAADGGAIGEEIPSTMEGVVQARIDRIDPGLRDALQASSVLGRQFVADGIGVLLGKPLEADVLVGRLVKLRFVQKYVDGRSGTEQFRFEHGVLHEVVYRGIPQQGRRAWHARAAIWQQGRLRENHPEDYSDVARHYDLSGDVPRAAHAWLKAGKVAHAASAAGPARRSLRNALALEAKHGVLESDVLAEAAALAGELAHKAGDLGEADELYEQAIDASGEHNSIWIAEQMRARALTLEAMGEVERSGQLIHEAHRLLGGELSGEALVLSLGLERYAAWLRYRAGDLQGAADDFDDLLSRVDDEEPILRGLVLNGRGVAAYGLGHYGDAEAFFQRAMARFEKAGSPARLCSAYNNLGMLAAKQGDARLATSWYEKAMRIHAKAGNRTGLAHTYNNLGSLYGELGDYQRSEGFLRESIRIRERSGHASVALGYANLGEVLLKRGEFDEAMAHLQRAIHLCQKGSGPAYLLPDAWRTLAEIRLAKGDLDAARDACNEAINLAEAGKDLPRMAAAYRVRGSVADADGQPDDAVAHIERAITYLEHIEQPLELARAYWDLAGIYERQNRTEHTELYARARSLFLETGARVPEK